MEAFLISTGVVALAEIGDKTQLLALVLAAKYRRPVPIILGSYHVTLVPDDAMADPCFDVGVLISPNHDDVDHRRYDSCSVANRLSATHLRLARRQEHGASSELTHPCFKGDSCTR